MEIKKGMLARSKAGHDAGNIYVITDADGAYVYLADGKSRTAARPKKKKYRHIQLISRACCADPGDDTQIRRIVKEFQKEEEI